MPVRIRLRRMGRKKQAHYRVVVADGAKAPNGRIVEKLGYYRPLSDPARLVLDMERVEFWLSKGALPSDTVDSLIKKARRGGDDSVAIGEPDPEEVKAKKAAALAAKRKAEKAAAEEAEAAEDEEAEAAAEEDEEPEAEAAVEEEEVEEEAAEEEAAEAAAEEEADASAEEEAADEEEEEDEEKSD